MSKRIGILISGRGSNMAALAEAAREGSLNGEIALVVSNVAGAPGLARAEEMGIATATFVSKGRKRAEHDADVAAALLEAGVELVCLAGYMRILSAGFVQQFAGRMLNIHPSLLPAFPGLNVQQAALDYGAKLSGCTVHFVDEELDHGPIVLQEAVPVLDDDTEQTLSARILELEHRLYPQAADLVARGAVRIEGRRVVRADTQVE
jgi:phosphoribosylglycinamide formyltransferase-1